MKEKIRVLAGPVLIIVTLAIVLISGMADGALSGALEAMRTACPGFLGLSALCYLGHLFLDAVSVRSVLRSEGYEISLKDAVAASVRGSFFSNITPGATGGQPMQIQRLNRCGISVGAGTSAVMTHFIAQHMMLTVLTVALGIPYLGFALSNVGASWPVLAIGLTYNTVMVTGVLVLCFSRRAVRWIVDRAALIAQKLRLSKDPEGLREKWLTTADHFHASMMHMKAHPGEMIRQLVFGGIQLVLLMSVLYFVCLSLGIQGAGFGPMLMMALCQHVSAAYMPMPGASGAQESVFGLYFGSLIPGSCCLAAMLIWRFMTYYLGLIIGGAVCLAERKREKNSMEIRRGTVPAKLKAARAELKTASAAGRERLKEGIHTLAEGEGTIQLTHSH